MATPRQAEPGATAPDGLDAGASDRTDQQAQEPPGRQDPPGRTHLERLLPHLRLLLRPVAIFAASRAAVGAALWLCTKLLPDKSPQFVVDAWDGGKYLLIVQEGYPTGPPDKAVYAFFPVFPMLARATSRVFGVSPLTAAVVVATLAGFTAAVGIWLLTERLLDRQTADRAVALFAFFPGSFVLSMVYAEGVMITLAVACLLALNRRRWLLAGVLAAVATASRPNALALVAACAWASLTAIRSRGEWRSLVAPALAPVGIVGFFGLLWARTGAPDAWFQVQRLGWNERVRPLAFVDDVRIFAAAPFENTNTTAVVLGAAVGLVGLALLLRSRLPGELVVYTCVVLGLALVSETLGPRPRFVLTAFPIFIAYALHLRGQAFVLAFGLSATVLGGFTVATLTTILFTP